MGIVQISKKPLDKMIFMQMIDKKNGKRYNFCHDFPTSSYEDISDIICVFKATAKKGKKLFQFNDLISNQ